MQHIIAHCHLLCYDVVVKVFAITISSIPDYNVRGIARLNSSLVLFKFMSALLGSVVKCFPRRTSSELICVCSIVTPTPNTETLHLDLLAGTCSHLVLSSSLEW